MEKRIGKNQKIDSEPIYPDVAGNAATVPMAGLEKFLEAKKNDTKPPYQYVKKLLRRTTSLFMSPLYLQKRYVIVHKLRALSEY